MENKNKNRASHIMIGKESISCWPISIQSMYVVEMERMIQRRGFSKICLVFLFFKSHIITDQKTKPHVLKISILRLHIRVVFCHYERSMKKKVLSIFSPTSPTSSKTETFSWWQYITLTYKKKLENLFSQPHRIITITDLYLSSSNLK